MRCASAGSEPFVDPVGAPPKDRPGAARALQPTCAPGAWVIRGRPIGGGNRDRILAAVGERPGLTREELETATGFSTAVVAQNLRRMVARGDLREQQLPGGQIGYATSPVDPDSARPPTGDGIEGSGAETGRASDPVAAEDR